MLLRENGSFENLLPFQEKLAEKYKYRKLSKKLSEEVRTKYLYNLPFGLKLEGDGISEIKSLENTLIAIGYKRIVIGDYGAFIEIDKSQMIKENLKCEEGQEYRYQDLSYKDKVKYFWYTPRDNSGAKIYYQQREVSYADYKPGMFYISPYEILI